MKYTLIITILIISITSACKKAQEIMYHAEDAVYFDFDPGTSDRDSVIYTFAYEPGALKDTVFLPVRISGNRVSKERKFGVMVVAQGTTANPNTHYEPFKDTYTMPADSGTFLLPVILYNTDPSLSRQSIIMKLKLTPSDDLDTSNNKLINAKIVFSNKLEQPNWWSMWLGSYYSQVKHQLFLISAGTTTLTLSGLDAPMNLYYTGKLNSFLNDPFTWVTNNPDKGYVLTARGDGNYDFYSIQNPANKILLRKNVSAGKFYFIDENGKEVI